MNLDQYQLLVVYLLLFVLVGVGFIFVHLVAGMFIRPRKPESEKLTIYECGEPTIGSAWVQFDLRFYVVALLFVIFDVEVAFFFPWAVVFGKANQLAKSDLPVEQRLEINRELVPLMDPHAKESWKEFETAVRAAKPIDPRADELSDDQQALQDNIDGARGLAWVALVDIALFFGILLVGFAYLWKRGDLEWVRSTSAEKLAESGMEESPHDEEELVGAGRE
jgi:NADH-quinone oxidoreductase subunit A